MEPTYWFDPLTIGAAAALGLVLGFVSVYLVQAVAAQRLGRLVGWGIALGALVLSGAGVYLGRFQRWNSWEAVTEPSKIFGGLARGLLDPARARGAAGALGVLRRRLLRRLRALLLPVPAAPAPPRGPLTARRRRPQAPTVRLG